MAHSYLKVKQGLDGAGVILSYSGFVTEQVLFALGETLKHKMREADRNVSKKVFSVFVELVQNIIRYSGERDDESAGSLGELGAGIVVVGTEEEGFFVVCANQMAREQSLRLSEKLSLLRAMSKDELKAYYRERLREPPEEQSKGASVGLIEIARRSSRPIEFDFLDLTEEESFFCLKSFV